MNWIRTFLSKKENIIVTIFLSLAIFLTLFIIWPQNKEFTAIGDIRPVHELGVDGSVYFTYVESGITASRYEELIVLLNFESPSFVSLTAEESAYLEEYYADETDEYKEATIENAVASANMESDTYQNEYSERVEEIIYQSEEYYGDSLGLMIAIGLVEEMKDKDYSRMGKYVIAGTGTIEADQTVGSVGAIREKLLTASSNGVDYFFIPRDKDYYYDPSYSNEVEAERVLEEEDLTIQVVPVATLDEAISFLENLP